MISCFFIALAQWNNNLQIDMSLWTLLHIILTPRPVLEIKIRIYWFKSNSWIYLYIHVVLNKNWKIYWSEQSFTGLGSEDRCSSWGLQDYQSLFLLLNTTYLVEKQQIPMLVFGLTRLVIEATIYHTRGKYANHNITDVVQIVMKYLPNIHLYWYTLSSCSLHQ